MEESKNSITYPLLILSFLVASVTPVTAIQIANFDTLTNDRFANDGSFVADQFDLSGVAHNGRWATMISENVYVTAEHFAPSVGNTMTFYANNDPGGTSVTRAITSNRQQIQGTDIFVGTLDAALPSGFSFFDFATEDIANGFTFPTSTYSGANAYAFGRSPNQDKTWPTSQNMAVGRNVLDGFAAGITVQNANSGDAILATDDRPGGVQFEAMLEVGDSGGPLFAENGEGGLTIVGANWFVGTSGDDEIFGASYLGNFDGDIQTFVTNNAVPEPANFALLLSVACGLLALHRRSRPKA